MKLKGPELKKPALKSPAFLTDFYYDLRDRRLLPVIALVLVAIVATPILLGRDSEPTLSPAAEGAIDALGESSGRATASLTVVEAKPGLRDYRKRLRNRTPLDPFRSLGNPSLKGARLGKGNGDGKESSSSSEFSSTSTTVKESTTKTNDSETTTTTKTTTTTHDKDKAGGGEGEGKGGGSGGSEPATYTIDVQISTAGQRGVSTTPLERTGVKPLTALPGEEKPVVTYLGPVPGASGKALFSVSQDVTAIFGEAKCISGAETCELLALEPDFPVTFAYGPNQDRYRVKLLRIRRAG